MIGDESGEFGVGSRHLHDSLKRLAVAQPKRFSEPLLNGSYEGLKNLPEEGPDSHFFILTALGAETLAPEVAAKANVLEF